MLRELFDKFSAGLTYRFLMKKVEGFDNIPRDGFIVASNHSSYLDIWIMECAFFRETRRYVRFLAKKELKTDSYISFLRKFYMTDKSYPIYMDRTKLDKEAFKNAIDSLNSGDIVGIFPEGGRTDGKAIYKGKTGSVRLAIWSEKPIVPLAFIGNTELMPRGKKFPKRKKILEVKAGKPIYYEKYYDKELTKDILEKETENLMKEISRLSKLPYKND